MSRLNEETNEHSSNESHPGGTEPVGQETLEHETDQQNPFVPRGPVTLKAATSFKSQVLRGNDK